MLHFWTGTRHLIVELLIERPFKHNSHLTNVDTHLGRFIKRAILIFGVNNKPTSPGAIKKTSYIIPT